MTKFKITFKHSVLKDLQSIPKKDVHRILNRINNLVEDPRGSGCIKLSGREHYRVRQGLYRIIYEIRDEVLIINVVAVGHRSSIYRKR